MLASCTIKGIYDATIDQTNERILVLRGIGRSEAEGGTLVSSRSIPICLGCDYKYAKISL